MNPAETNIVNRRLNMKHRRYLYLVQLYRFGEVILLLFTVAIACELYTVKSSEENFATQYC